MTQELLFDIGLSICDLFVGHPVETRNPSDRCRAAQLALLNVLLKGRSGRASADDIVRDRGKAYGDGGKWLGRAIAQLAEDGLIRSCGTRNSRRTARNAGLLHEWEIADRKAAELKVERLKLTLIFHKKTDSAGATTESANPETHSPGKDEIHGQAN